MDNKTAILKEFEKLKGQFVITGSGEVVRLIAISDDNEDYYYVTYDGRNFTWNSCVGRLIPLKGYLRPEDYNELVRLARLNHYDQSDLWGSNDKEFINSFNIQHKHELSQLTGNNRFLTELCWDLENC